ncbi:MAG TPA: outer-membrane lipoprotein carrier protein LolA, partial [Phenylobacterium sp.]
LPVPALAQRAAASALSAADKALVAKAVAYLEGLSEAKGRFVQTDPRGAVSQGSLYLKRPGKARFAYDPPAGLLVVSDGGKVSVHNTKLKTFEAYPLSATPLSLFLARQIRLDRGVVVSRVTRYADGFAITARDGRKQAEGAITLTFADNPMRLLAWTVTDAQGGATRVQLSGFARTSGLAPSLFVLNDPRPRAVGRGKM